MSWSVRVKQMSDSSPFSLDVEPATTIEQLLCMYCKRYYARYGGGPVAECLRVIRPYAGRAAPNDSIESLGVLDDTTVVLETASYALWNESDTYAGSGEEVVPYDAVAYEELASIPLAQAHVHGIGCAPWAGGVNNTRPLAPNRMWRTYQCAIFGPPRSDYANSVMFLRMQLNLCGARALPVHANFLTPVPHHPMVRKDGRILNQLYWDSQSAFDNGAMSVVSVLRHFRQMLSKKYSTHTALRIRSDRVSDAPQFWTFANRFTAKHRARVEHYAGQFGAQWKMAESILVPRLLSPGLVSLVCSYFTHNRKCPGWAVLSQSSW